METCFIFLWAMWWFCFFPLEDATVAFAMKADVHWLLTLIVIAGQDGRLQEREQEPCIPGVVLRSPQVFGWEVTF